MHTVVEPRYIVQRYHTGLMLHTVYALGFLVYRWYLIFFMSLCPPCQMGLPQFILLDQILCFYCALRCLKSCDILLFPDYAGSTDGWKARAISKRSWVITISIFPKAGSRQVLSVKSPYTWVLLSHFSCPF
jgi:hypothetical protein